MTEFLDAAKRRKESSSVASRFLHVLFASLNSDLELAFGWFSADCDAAGMRISTSQSEAMVLSWVGEEFFKYLRVFLMSEGIKGAVSAVMGTIIRSVVVRRDEPEG